MTWHSNYPTLTSTHFSLITIHSRSVMTDQTACHWMASILSVFCLVLVATRMGWTNINADGDGMYFF